MTKKKELLIVDLTPFFGGGQKFILNIHNRLASNMYYIVKDRMLFDNLLTDKKKLLTKDIGIRATIAIINKFISANNISVVILNGNRPIYMAPFIKTSNKIAYKHTSRQAIPIYYRYIALFILNIAYLFCKKIIILYQDMKNEVWFNKKRSVVINNSILPAAKTQAKQLKIDSVLKIVCVSRIDENKGIHWLIDSFKSQFKNRKDVVLEIAGDGELLEEFRKNIVEQDISNICLKGFVGNISDFLASADLFILPSKFEAFPLSILEAMSCRLPIIATRTGGIPEMVINDMNGFLVEYNNSKDLSCRLNYLINSPSVLYEMGEKSYMFFNEKFGFDQYLEKMEQLF